MALTRPRLGQFNTTVSSLSDPMTVLHGGATQANVDVGFLLNRANGLVSNVALYWNEASNSFVTAYTNSTGTSDSNISPISYANLTVGTLTANTLSVAGGGINGVTIGSITPAAGTFTDLQVNGNLRVDGTVTFTNTVVETTTETVLGVEIVGGNLVANSGTVSTDTTTGALVVSGGAGISGTVYVGGTVVANGVDLVANALTQSESLDLLNANVGAFESYANIRVQTIDANVGTVVSATIPAIQANLGAYQNYANANLGTATTNISTLQANVGAYEQYANVALQTLDANIGAFETYSNLLLQTIDSNIGAFETYANLTLQSIDSNVGAFETYANIQIQDINANLGAYQTYANTQVQTIDANVGAFETYANIELQTVNANIGAFEQYANANLGTATTNITTLFGNAASQQTQIDNIVTTANANTAAYLTTSAGAVDATFASVVTNNDLTVGGNLIVNGVTTTINSTTLDVDDLNVTVAKGAPTSLAANGAGLTVDGAGATLLYASTTDSWNFNKQVIGQFTTSNLVATGGTINNTPIGATSASTGTFTTLTANALVINTEANINTDLYVSGNIIQTGTGYQTLPVGTTSQRPGTPTQGMVRYNTTLSSFEGYGSAWSSLGGVKSVDGLTYILAEATVGASDDTLWFYANGTNVATLTESQFVLHQTTPSTSRETGTLIVHGGAGIDGNLNVGSTADSIHLIRGNIVLGRFPQAAMADSYLTINGANAAPQIDSTMLHIQGHEGFGTRITLDSNADDPFLTGQISSRRSRGTAESPEHVHAGDRLLIIGARGRGTTGYLPSTDPAPATISFIAADGHSDTAQATYIEVLTTPFNSTAPQTAMVFEPTGNITIPRGNITITQGNIHLGNTVIRETAGNSITVDTTSSFVLPVGTTGERGDLRGAIRYNVTSNRFESYDGSSWNVLAYSNGLDGFPTGNYGDLTGTMVDPFGARIALTADCNADGAITVTDLGTL